MRWLPHSGPVGEKMLKRVMPAGAAALALLVLSGCAGQMPNFNSLNSNDPGQRAIGGALIGASTGALTGGLIGGWEGAGVGAAAGGVIGAVAGAATTPGGVPLASADPAPVYQPPASSYPATPSFSSPSSYSSPSYSTNPAPVVQR